MTSTATKTIPLRFGQWHFWTKPTAQPADSNDVHQFSPHLMFLLPELGGGVRWVQNYLPLMGYDLYALEYDQRIGQETMQSLCKHLAEQVTQLLKEHQCTSYSVMGYSMGSCLAYGLMQEMPDDRQPKRVVFIDSSPALLFRLKDVRTPMPKADNPQMQRGIDIALAALETLSTITKPPPLEQVTKNPPHLLVVRAKEKLTLPPGVELPEIPDDLDVSDLTSNFVLRFVEGNHRTVNEESCAEIVAFLEEFAIDEEPAASLP